MQKASLSSKFKTLALLVVLGSRGQASACDVEEKKIQSSTVFVNKNLEEWGFDSNSRGDAITVVKCGAKIQLAMGVNIPSPSDFSTETWLKNSATAQRRCEVKSSLPKIQSAFRNTPQDLRSTVDLASDCMGIQVSDAVGTPITLEPSLNCKLVAHSPRKDTITLQGDNCIIRAASVGSRLRVQPVFLKSTCASSSVVRSQGPFDLDISLKVLALAGGDAHPEALADKPVRVVFTEEVRQVRNSSVKPKDFQVTKSSAYALSFELADLRLQGSKETGMMAGTQFYVSQKSNAHLPFVVKSNLILLKKDASQNIHLGTWYSGSIIPPRWHGLDGLSELHSIAVTNRNFNLNKSVRQIEKGDRIMVVATLQSPNVGPQRFWQYATGLLRKKKASVPTTTEPGATNLIEPIKPLDGISTIEGIKEIPDIESLNSQTRETLKAFSNKWPIRFDTFCTDDNSQCRSFEELDEMVEVRALYEVEDADLEIKVRPVRYAKTSALEKEEVVSRFDTNTEIKCY